jgi:UDP-N-acetylmuramoylalanine--D-glutamate ligase
VTFIGRSSKESDTMREPTAVRHNNYRNRRVLVMGLGVHGGGLGTARWLLEQGADVVVTDSAAAELLAAPAAALQAYAAELGRPLRMTLGEHRREDFAWAEELVINPAVRPSSPWLRLAAELNLAVETEMTIFFRRCRGPILGVTGSKGKTTTTLLLTEMLRRAAPQTVAAGNLRVSALAALADIDAQTPVVLELSSFQLERLGAVGLAPRYSLITNIGVDHVDWHGSLAAYRRAKQQIYLAQPADGIAVLPLELVREWQPARAGIISYSIDELQADAVVDRDGMLRLHGRELLPQSVIRLAGRHNLANVLAAAALAAAFGVAAADLQAAAAAFSGVEHRLETVRELDGIRYINDTTATNPSATEAALAAVDGPIVLISGGADKQLDLAHLAAVAARRAAHIVLLAGSATAPLQQLLGEQPQQVATSGPYDDLDAALAEARRCARPGGAVLLSPGCASFGMFRNEFDRGERFRAAVAALRPHREGAPA